MDGLQDKVNQKGKVNQTLEFRLQTWVALIVVTMAVISGIFSFAVSYHEANELQDDQLMQIAALINRHHFNVTQAEFLENVPHTDPESRVIVQTIAQAKIAANGSSSGPLNLPGNLKDGLQTITVHGEEWRLFVKKLDSGDRIAIGQQTTIRNEAAHDAALITLMPILTLIPILLIMLSVLIHKLFKPLLALVSTIDQRSEYDFSEIENAGLPAEISPLVLAINRLLRKIEQGVTMQRQFIADAAHELRSPLAALSLQAERLQAEVTPDEMNNRVTSLRGGIQRMGRLLEQLLTLARVQTAMTSDLKATGDLKALFIVDSLREVIEDFVYLLESKKIDFTLKNSSHVSVFVDELKLKIMLKNILENAIKYTPCGGQIEISIDADQQKVTIHVDDNGPGIDKSERERVFDKFYRIPGSEVIGSGLGLSIVKTIAENIGAEVSLQDSPIAKSTSGLRVTLILPLNSPITQNS